MSVERIGVGDLVAVGQGVLRPECCAVTKDGRVFASDGHAAVSEILADGTRRPIGNAGHEPNGIQVTPDNRSILIANYAGHALQICDIESGETRLFCNTVAGRPLRNPNYPIYAQNGSIYCTSSTESDDSIANIVYGVPDGYLFRVLPDGETEVLVEDLLLPNGLALDANEEYLYCCRTSAGDIVRFPIKSDGTLGPQEPYGAPFGERRIWGEDAAVAVWGDAKRTFANLNEVWLEWGLVDGCAFDLEGNLWVACVVNNRIDVIDTRGATETIIHDPSGSVMMLPTNINFGGSDMRDVYIGNMGAHVVKTCSTVPGLPLAAQR